jgi:uracil-DNA glycosylase
MAHSFDPGYNRNPYKRLVANYPGPDIYPAADFRIEWGPIFHRGRLDGTARILIIGQDPGAHETIARRILVGEAGQRIQGFLAKLGVHTAYTMINTFVYSVYGQGGGERHKDDPAIAAYRHQWLDALTRHNQLQAVIALGGLADHAYQQWQTTLPEPPGFAYAHIPHPTYPESASAHGQTTKKQATQQLLQAWNQTLDQLRPHITPEQPPTSTTYTGTDHFQPDDLATIPEHDLPPGLPDWMRSLKAWANRTGPDPATKRITLQVTIPRGFRP